MRKLALFRLSKAQLNTKDFSAKKNMIPFTKVTRMTITNKFCLIFKRSKKSLEGLIIFQQICS